MSYEATFAIYHNFCKSANASSDNRYIKIVLNLHNAGLGCRAVWQHCNIGCTKIGGNFVVWNVVSCKHKVLCRNFQFFHQQTIFFFITVKFSSHYEANLRQILDNSWHSTKQNIEALVFSNISKEQNCRGIIWNSEFSTRPRTFNTSTEY